MKTFILKNGDVCQELRNLRDGKEPAHSYIAEIFSLRTLGQLHVGGHADKADRESWHNVHGVTFARGRSAAGQFRVHRALWRYLREVDPDLVVVLHPWELLLVPYLWSRIKDRRFVPCLPKPVIADNMSGSRRLLARAAIRPVLSRVPRILARCDFIKDGLGAWGVDPVKVTVYTPNYTKDFFQKERALPLEPGDFNIVFIGRLVRLKGVFDILRILKSALTSVPCAKLFVVGEGPERGALEEMAEEMGIGRSVVFLGEVPGKDVYGYLAPADLALLPSYQEGIGKTALEALLAGVPVLATSGTGFTQFIRHGENGYLFPPGSVKEFSRKLVDLYRDREALSGLRERAARTGEEILQGSRTFAMCIEEIAADWKNGTSTQ